jgi:hypothetical protein
MKQLASSFKLAAFVFALFGMLAISAGLAYGQAIDGSVLGTVLDSQGAAVVGAEITATNVATGVVAVTKTNNAGEYRFDHLLVGTYKITAKMTGFKTITEQVDVELNKIGTRNLSLTPGAASETIEVSGTPPTIDTTTSQLQTTYDERQLQDLPSATVGSGVLNLSLLQAGVGSTGGLGAGSGPSVGGQRPRENNFTIEGEDNNDKGVTGPLVTVPNDAVANFTVIQNQFAPEFGHSAGGQFNQVVMGGTNTIHGRVYEYFRNRNLNALDQTLKNQDITTVPRYDNNRFGGQVGGPILKNKLFYFVNFEYNPIGEAAVPTTAAIAPTAAGWATILGIPGIVANNANGFAAFATAPGVCSASQISGGVCPAGGVDQNGNPIAAGNIAVYDNTTATPTQYQIPVGVIPIVSPAYVNNRALVTSMDYDVSDKDQIRGRYIYNKEVTIDTGAELPQFFTPLVVPQHLVTLAEYHTFSPTIGNEFRVGYTRTGYNYVVPTGALGKFENLDAFPNLTIDELNLLNVGPDPNAPQYAQQNTYQLLDNLSWTRGAHTLKFGIDLRKQIDPQLFVQRSRGDYEWNTVDNFVHDTNPTGIAERSFGSASYSGNDKMFGWYVNDVWKATRNLTVNLGVRYEYLTTPYGWSQQALNSVADVPGLITFAAPTAPKHDFMPRIGFAYSPGNSGNTSIRAGFGMGYDVLYDNIGTLARPPQIGSTVDCPNQCTAPFLTNGGIPPEVSSGISVLTPAQAIARTSSYLPINTKYPYAESWTLGVQHVFAGKYTAEVRYLGSRGIDLPIQTQLNTTPIATPSNSVPEFVGNATPPNPDTLTNIWAVNAATCPASVCPAGAGDAPGTLEYQYFDTNDSIRPAFNAAGFNSSIMTSYQPWGSSTYHGLATQLQRRFSNGLQFLAAWTWSHTIDNATADFHSTDISPRRAQNFSDYPAERANSILDHAHRITFQVLYDAQWFAHDSSWLKRNVIGNYEFVPVYTWESGQWGTVQSAIDSNLNDDAAGDRAFLNPAGVKGTGSDVNPLLTVANPNCPYNPCVVGWVAATPSAQYVVAGYGTIATTSRSNLQTAPINNFDMTVAKHLKFGERFQVDFLAQAFNMLNHAQFTTGYLNDIGSIGDVGAVRNFFIPNSSGFDNNKANFSSSPRTMQLALKFSF